MKILPTVLAITAAAVSTTSAFPQSRRSEPVLVRVVLDGDTIDVSTYGRVRLLGIDAPEVSHGLDTPAPFGPEARERLASMILHRWIRLEYDGPLLDVYKRRLAYVLREDAVCVNAAIVREGLARVSAREPLARLNELKAAEAEAQAFRRGIWGAAPPIPSASYTRPSRSQPKRKSQR
jgi:micrococcal nuclease